MKPYEHPPTNISINPIQLLASTKPKSHLRILPVLENNRPMNPFFHKVAQQALQSDELYLKTHAVETDASQRNRHTILGSPLSNKYTQFYNPASHVQSSDKRTPYLLVKKQPAYKTRLNTSNYSVFSDATLGGPKVQGRMDKWDSKKMASMDMGHCLRETDTNFGEAGGVGLGRSEKPKTRKKVNGTFCCKDVGDLVFKIKDSIVYRHRRGGGEKAKLDPGQSQDFGKEGTGNLLGKVKFDLRSDFENCRKARMGKVDPKSVPFEPVKKKEADVSKTKLLNRMNLFFKKRSIEDRGRELVDTAVSERWFLNKIARVAHKNEHPRRKSLHVNYLRNNSSGDGDILKFRHTPR
jgi:hypothetical protein